MAWPKFSWRTPASPRRRKAMPTPGRVGEKLGAKTAGNLVAFFFRKLVWIQTIGSLVNPCWALALVGASAVPAATPCGKNLSCNWNATKKCMDEKGDITKIAGKLTGKHIETWISVCNHRSFRIDRNVSTAREPSSWAPPPVAQHHGHQRTGNEWCDCAQNLKGKKTTWQIWWNCCAQYYSLSSGF